MGQRWTRLVSVLAAGGVLSATLLAGAGAATAAPTLASGTVNAQCGGAVRAQKGDTVRVAGPLGLSFSRLVSASGPISSKLGTVLCVVQVTVVQPATSAAAAVPPVRSATGAVGGAVGALPGAGGAPSRSASSPGSAATTTRPAPASATPTGATPAPGAPASAPPAVAAAAAAASAPAFAPFFATLPASFLSSALTAPGTAARVASFGGGATYDAGMLFGSAFPALRAGAPFSAGFDAANAVTSTSQLQALPVDGLGDGLGVPLVLAVLVLSGMAAFAVRRSVLARGAVAADTTPGASGTGTDGTAAA